jgi:hypothetical protein
MTKEEQQARAALNDHIVIHKVTDNILAMHKDGTAVYAVDVIKKPLVMCKECKYWKESQYYQEVMVCTYVKGATFTRQHDDFCSRGEREGER